MQLKKPEKKGGNYLNKFEEGTTRIRILSDPIIGSLYWVLGEGGKNSPRRLKESTEELEAVPAEALPDKYGNYIKNFWAFAVYNYQEKKVQIMEIVQTTIQDQLYTLNEDPDWGDLKQYDIKINKIEGDRIKYEVLPAPKTELSMEVANAYAETTPNLEALYEGEDPFDNTNQVKKK